VAYTRLLHFDRIGVPAMSSGQEGRIKMADIGKPVRRITVVPLTEPIQPTHEPTPKVPSPKKEPVNVPEPVPA
jgi:hypothetical protein